MSINKLSPRKSLFAQEITTHFTDLRGNPLTKVQDIGAWFEKNMTHASKVLTGRSGRKVTKFTPRYWKLEHTGSEPILSAFVTWNYLSFQGQRPDLETIAQFVHDIDIRTWPDYSFDTHFFVEMRFDAAKWPQLIPAALHYFLRIAFIDETVDAETKANASGNIQLLTSRYYPTLSYAFLTMAVDMGVLENGEPAFTAWFDSHISSVEPASTTLPDNIV